MRLLFGPSAYPLRHPNTKDHNIMRKALALAGGLALFATALLRLPPAALGQGQSVAGTGIVSQGSSLPATCNPATGDISQKVFYMTSGATPGLYYCSALNTWTGAGGGLTINATNNVLPKRSNATTFVDSALTDNGTAVIGTEPIRLANGTNLLPAYSFSSDTATGFWGQSGQVNFSESAFNTNTVAFNSSGVVVNGAGVGIGWSPAAPSGGSMDTGFVRDGAGIIDVGTGATGSKTGTLQAAKYNTGTNCSSSASPAVCASAAAGSVAVPTGTNPTLVVNTTAVTANSQIMLQSDESLGTKLSVTCNTTLGIAAAEPVVTARVAATSFTIQISGTVSTNPACVSYLIVN